MKPVRLGVIGCGVIGTRHLAEAHQSSVLDVVAVADVQPERAREAADRFGVPRRFGRAEELLALSEVEAIVLALPTGVRAPVARESLKAGKHVLLEKPVAMNAAELKGILALRRERVAACCSSRYRMLPSARAAADCIASGVLGEIRVVRARAIEAAEEAPAMSPPPWRQSMALNGGGILVNWGSYDLDFLLGITGWQLVPRLVLAQWWPVAQHLRARVAPGSDADSHIIAEILCERGTVISFERAEFAASAGDEAWEILGRQASLRLSMTSPSEIVLDEADADKGVQSRTIWTGSDDSCNIHLAVLEDFAHAIRDGRPPATDLEQALLIQQLTDAIYASARTGQAAEVER